MVTRRNTPGRHLAIVRDMDRNPLVAKHLAYCAQNLRRSPHTIAQKRAALASLTHWLVGAYGGNAADPELLLGVDLPDLLAWQRSLAVRLTANSLGCYTAAVRSFYRWCASKASGRLLEEDPAEEVPPVSMTRGLPHPIDDEHLRMALACSAASDPEMYAMLMAGAGLALRCQGIAQLDKHHVQWDDAAETVLVTIIKKGGKPISLQGGPPVHGAFLPYRHRSGPWFTMRCGVSGRQMQITPRAVSKRIGRYLRSLGIDSTAHELRHWALTHAYAARRDLLAVKEFAGHASLQQTVGYVALVDGAGSQTGQDVGSAITDLMGGRRAIRKNRFRVVGGDAS